MPALSQRPRPTGGLRLWISRPAVRCLIGLHVQHRRAEDVFGFVAHLSRIGRGPIGPDAAGKRLPLHENGFHIRQNEIRQPHRDDYNGISLPRWGRIELASEAIPGTSQSGDLPRRSQAQREKAAGDLYE